MCKYYGVMVEMFDIKGVMVCKIMLKFLFFEFKDYVYIDIYGGVYVLFVGLFFIEEGILVVYRLGIVVYSVDYRMLFVYLFFVVFDDVKYVYCVLF